MTELLGVPPHALCSSLFSWVSRPRLWWLPWTIQASAECDVVPRKDYLDIEGKGWRPAREHWVDRGCRWLPTTHQ